jgi:molybdopterin-guanine dinucleotide biosynthesis protein A
MLYWHPDMEGITSTILAGGQSRRMGTDKALLRLTPDGPTLIETVIGRLHEAGIPPSFVVTDRPGRYGWLGVPEVVDEWSGAGPLGGILAALRNSPHPCILIVACDMPLLNPSLLRYMASLPITGGALVPRYSVEWREVIEPLHAIYSSRCVDLLRARVEAGLLRVTNAIGAIDPQFVEENTLRLHDPYLSSFRNVNTPQEWSTLLTKASE